MSLQQHLAYLKELQEQKSFTTEQKVIKQKIVRSKNRLKQKTFRNKKT